MKKFNNVSELLNHLVEVNGFERYNLNEGFEQWEADTLASSGSVSLEEFEENSNLYFEKFEWIDENKNDKFAELSIVRNDETEEEFYILHN